MTRRWASAFCALVLISAVGCEGDETRMTGPPGSDALSRFVSIGTSITMGYQSAGVLYSGQANSWAALLADQSFAPFREPLITAPGCTPPIIAPLQFGRLLSGLPVGTDNTCAPLYTGIALPTNNVAIAGALTQDALALKPSDLGAGLTRERYLRVLPEDRTQVTAMLAQNPTFVAVELGANEVLGAATTGLVAAGVTFVPPAFWQPVYEEVIDSVQKTGARALLVTVPQVTNIPSMRTGPEIWAQRLVFAAFNVVVDADCETSPNTIFIAQLAPRKVAEGLQRAAMGAGPATLSCADVPGTVDFILTPADVGTLTAVVSTMNTAITALADENGYALLDANEVLATIMSQRPAYDLQKQLGCSLPYGQYMSLDGVHPNSFGHRLIANAAASAINEQYGFQLPATEVPVLPDPSGC